MDSRTNSKGLNKILFRVYENRAKRNLYTEITRPKEFYDTTSQLLLPLYVGDVDVAPFNLRINEYKAQAHRIALTGYLEKSDITLEDVVNKFKAIKTDDDFLPSFWLKQTNFTTRTRLFMQLGGVTKAA